MKKRDKTTKGKKQSDRAPAKPAGMTELTEKDLEQVQGGFQTGSSGSSVHGGWDSKAFFGS